MIARRLFNVVALISLLLCATSIALWAVSLQRELFVEHTTFSPNGLNWYWLNWQLWSQDGVVRYSSTGVDTNSATFNSTWQEQPGQWTFKNQPLGTSGPTMGFPENLRPGYATLSGTFGSNRQDVIGSKYATLMVPYWCLIGLSLPLPVVWFVLRRRQRRRERIGACPTCGYNLTANTSGVCPECGTAVVAAVQ